MSCYNIFWDILGFEIRSKMARKKRRFDFNKFNSLALALIYANSLKKKTFILTRKDIEQLLDEICNDKEKILNYELPKKRKEPK